MIRRVPSTLDTDDEYLSVSRKVAGYPNRFSGGRRPGNGLWDCPNDAHRRRHGRPLFGADRHGKLAPMILTWLEHMARLYSPSPKPSKSISGTLF